MRRLAIGSAQFGLAYGISNRQGKTDREEVARILSVAGAAGVDTIDTAVAYGDSEAALGAAGMAGWRIVSKIPAVPACQGDVAKWVVQSVRDSLTRLRINSLDGLLLHRPGDLDGSCGEQLLEGLLRVKKEGLVEKIGVSVYGPDEVRGVMNRFLPDLVQIPFSPVDQRVLRSGLLSQLQRDGVEVHVRSIFLQGLLLMPPEARPSFFQRWDGVWRLWSGWLAENSITPLQACLRFALQQPEISRVIVGVENVEQLEGILAAADGALPVLPRELQCADEELVNPSLWRKI
jgi:aryl-alcohol dehydrogenase-like predicted oxidoreductase